MFTFAPSTTHFCYRNCTSHTRAVDAGEPYQVSTACSSIASHSIWPAAPSSITT